MALVRDEGGNLMQIGSDRRNWKPWQRVIQAVLESPITFCLFMGVFGALTGIIVWLVTLPFGAGIPLDECMIKSAIVWMGLTAMGFSSKREG